MGVCDRVIIKLIFRETKTLFFEDIHIYIHTIMSDTAADTPNYLKLGDIEIRFVSLDNRIEPMVRKVFADLGNVSGKKTVIQVCEEADCIVSPANSFGQMDGGIDAALTEMLSTDEDADYIGKKVRKVIWNEYFGEQPIGTCLMIPTDNEKFPWLAHAPTMTTPMNVKGSFNPYYAFKAVLGEVLKVNRSLDLPDHRIKSVLTTTFATGCGGVEMEEALEQMRLAYDQVDECVEPSWRSASDLRSTLIALKERWDYGERSDSDEEEDVSGMELHVGGDVKSLSEIMANLLDNHQQLSEDSSEDSSDDSEAFELDAPVESDTKIEELSESEEDEEV